MKISQAGQTLVKSIENKDFKILTANYGGIEKKFVIGVKFQKKFHAALFGSRLEQHFIEVTARSDGFCDYRGKA
jgi:hypothetical protein